MQATATPPSPTVAVHRIEIHPLSNATDPRAQKLMEQASNLNIPIERAHIAHIYLIEAPLTDDQLDAIATKLLANPVIERIHIGASEPIGALAEVHPLPGVMDPPAMSVANAIKSLTGIDALVSTGTRYDLVGISDAKAQTLIQRLYANPIVAAVHAIAYFPDELPKGHPHDFALTHVPMSNLDDAGLEKLSREGHLFLSLDEMRAIQSHFQALNREPTDIELETLAQTWSEHCVHKTLKSTIHYTGDPTGDVAPETRPGITVHDDGSYTIDNLLKSTVAAATFELIDEGIDWTLSVFVDNAGIVKFDDTHAVCIKVETHNHPSALEPYGGAATGIGGCIRDIIGTGMAAKPIASTDVFCVAHPNAESVPAGCIHPEKTLREIVAGVGEYGNRMGIPTINGAVSFDNRYIGNPLVYCGCIGIMPIDLISGDAQPGDRIIALGGRTGRDGIHGATFSSAELTDTHADEFSHAVQIGNAIEEKRVLDAILRARGGGNGQWAIDNGKKTGQSASSPLPTAHCPLPSPPLFTAITDCGAGGFSSAIGEMGEQIGAFVNLEQAPLKYAGLSYTEIWISEAQERMILAVPQANIPALQKICDEEHVEMADLGYFGTPQRELILNYNTTEVGRLPMHFMHDGIPTPTRIATWKKKESATEITEDTEKNKGIGSDSSSSLSPLGERAGVRGKVQQPSIKDALLQLLAHPNIASKHWIIRQYDHEVQGNTILKPLVGPRGIGPGDAAVVEPVPGSGQGLSVGCGLATGLSDDPYWMTLAAIDECVRNLVCVGTDPSRISILDNFSWPSCNKPENLGSLVRAAQGCYDGAKAYKTPFVSGKDSLNNQFTTEDGTTIEIPPTLLITGMGIVQNIDRCITSDAKAPGNTIMLIGSPQRALAGSHASILNIATNEHMPKVDLDLGPKTAHAIHQLIAAGLIESAHDISDGGPLVALAEMLIAGSSKTKPIGFASNAALDATSAFAESPSCYLVEVRCSESVTKALGDIQCQTLGTLNDSGALRWDTLDIGVEELTKAWRSTLDWS